MAYRNDVYLLCTPEIGNTLKKVIEPTEKSYQPEIIDYTDAVFFKWSLVPWDPYYYDFCKNIYNTLRKYENNFQEGYKLIRLGEKTIDIEEEFNERGLYLFDDEFFTYRTVQLPIFKTNASNNDGFIVLNK